MNKRLIHSWSRAPQEHVTDVGSGGPEFRLPLGDYQLLSDLPFDLELRYKNGGSMGMVTLEDGCFSVTDKAKSRFAISFGPGKGHLFLMELTDAGDIFPEFSVSSLTAQHGVTVNLEAGAYALDCLGTGPSNKLAVSIQNHNGRAVAPMAEYTGPGTLIVSCRPYGKVTLLCEQGAFDTISLTPKTDGEQIDAAR